MLLLLWHLLVLEQHVSCHYFWCCSCRLANSTWRLIDQIITRVSLVKVDISSLIGHRSETARSSGDRPKGRKRRGLLTRSPNSHRCCFNSRNYPETHSYNTLQFLGFVIELFVKMTIDKTDLFVTIKHDSGATVKILKYGATVISWKTANGQENLFLSEYYPSQSREVMIIIIQCCEIRWIKGCQRRNSLGTLSRRCRWICS